MFNSPVSPLTVLAFSLLGVVVAIAGIAITISRMSMNRKLRAKQAAVDRLFGRLAAYKLANEALESTFWSWRNVFDHFSAYVQMDENLSDLLFRIARVLPSYARALPDMLQPLRSGEQASAGEAGPREFPRDLRDGEDIDILVNHINDPVLNRLWAARTPWALTEMLRHGLFMGFGYPFAVGDWRPEGVNLKFWARKPDYTNWGCRTLESLDGHHSLWEKWRRLAEDGTERQKT